jgi:hypothetical protein
MLTRTPHILTDVYCGFLQSLHADFGIVPQLGQVYILPNPFEFIIHPTAQCYTVLILRVFLNNQEEEKGEEEEREEEEGEERKMTMTTKKEEEEEEERG